MPSPADDFPLIAGPQAFFAKAQGKVNSKIDAEADKQHREGYRN